jgi:ABC-type anion transport system duplicated permease subunit
MSELLTPFELFDVDYILSREIKPGFIPAADRVVSLSHNQPEYIEAIEALDRMQEALRGENTFKEDGEEKVAETELSLIRQLLDGSSIRIKSLWALAAASLTALKKRMWDTLVGQTAAFLLGKLWLLVKALVLLATGIAL